MKLEKIQIEILKAVLKDPMRVSCHETPDGTGWLVTTNGYVVYNIPKNLLRVDLNHCQMSMGLSDLFDRALEIWPSHDKPLTPTDHYRRGGTVQRFLYDDDENSPVYIDKNLLAVFDHPELYMIGNYSPKNLLAVFEYTATTDDSEIVGIICPVNIKEDKKENEINE